MTPKDQPGNAKPNSRSLASRIAVIAAVVIVLAVMLMACAKYDGDQAEFCTQLEEVPSFMALSAKANQGSASDAQAAMLTGAAQFRSLESVAPRKIRHTVAALGDSAERIAEDLAPHPTTTQVVTVYMDDGSARKVRIPNSESQSRLGAFYTELQNHHGTISAVYSLTRYAEDVCGIADGSVDLGMAGLGFSDTSGPGFGEPGTGITPGFGSPTVGTPGDTPSSPSVVIDPPATTGP